MQILLSIILTVPFLACSYRQGNTTIATTKIDTFRKHDTSQFSPENNLRDWQQGFGLTHNPDKDSIWFKPVSYYLSDKACSKLASDFYYGRKSPADDDITDELLKLASIDNKKLRPFYRWCLNKTIIIQDGALAEHTGVPARQYAEKFPIEFFAYMDIDTTGEKLSDWIASISYSGFYDLDDSRKPKEIQQKMAHTMKSHCKDCDEKTISRIDKFTNDCFN
jgi:hypothetical protein